METHWFGTESIKSNDNGGAYERESRHNCEYPWKKVLGEPPWARATGLQLKGKYTNLHYRGELLVWNRPRRAQRSYAALQQILIASSNKPGNSTSVVCLFPDLTVLCSSGPGASLTYKINTYENVLLQVYVYYNLCAAAALEAVWPKLRTDYCLCSRSARLARQKKSL